MRIGILTLPLHTNYGGILQAYALQTVLERMGHKVVVFDTHNEYSLPPLWKLPLCFAKRIVMKCLGKSQNVFLERHLNHERHVIAQYIQPFVDNHIHRKVICNFSTLEEKDYDAIVVGSDQVWRAFYFSGSWLHLKLENAYLAFAKDWNIKRIAYAASFGTDDWEYTDEETLNCKELVKEFDAVSVREESGVYLCNNKFDVTAQHVLDPTMLLSIDDYISIFQKENTPKSKGNLLNYVLDENEEINLLIGKVAAEKQLIPFAVNNLFESDETIPLQYRIKISVEAWLRGFYDAEFVITDSFHACVFSILFKKQFVVVGNKERGMSRFESLLKIFDLKDRLVDANVDLSTLQQIDYGKVYGIYDKLKNKSMTFLYENLNS